jgi:hypothetical protein
MYTCLSNILTANMISKPIREEIKYDIKSRHFYK